MIPRRAAPTLCGAMRRMRSSVSAPIAAALRACAAALAAAGCLPSQRPRCQPPTAALPLPARAAQIAYPVNAHRSNAASLVSEVPPIVVASGHVAMCDGGGGTTGHPIEYLQLELRAGAAPSLCRYCGLRYVAAHHH